MTRGRPPKWPLLSLEIGQSLTIPITPQPKVSSLLCETRKRHPEYKFAQKKLADGIEITRVSLDYTRPVKHKHVIEVVALDGDVTHEDL